MVFRMKSDATLLLDLLTRARAGDSAAVGLLLEQYRPYLRILAQRHLDGPLGVRLDASDLVQQTCLSAVRAIASFDGASEAAFVAWLRTIHENNIRAAVRDHLLAEKRAAGREVSAADEEAIDRSLAQARESSPSQRLMQGENVVRLAAALQELPADQREAVRLRYLEGRSLAEIAQRLDRSVVAAAGLVKRGLMQLRRILRDESDS
jgi:RNA polymerase sigma-70 factor (ECF subfamily)